MELYFGNSVGVLIGPYDPGEIGPQLRAKKKLSDGGQTVWAIHARDWDDAAAKLAKARSDSE
jgi:hypothetical protein